MRYTRTTAHEETSSPPPPILPFPHKGGRNTSCGLLPPSVGEDKGGGEFSEEHGEY